MKIRFFTIFLGFWVVGLGAMDAPGVFTPKSKQVRATFVRAFADAVYGNPPTLAYVDRYVAQCEAEDALMKASPKELFQQVCADHKDSIQSDFEAHGVTPELVARFKNKAQEAVRQDEAGLVQLPLAASPLRKVARQVMDIFPGQLNVPVLKTDNARSDAQASGSLLLVNEDRVKTGDCCQRAEASWIFAHELYHIHDQHYEERARHQLAIKSLSPNAARDRVYKEMKYLHEVASDLGLVVEHYPLAMGYKMRVDRWVQASGKYADTDGRSHPSDRKRQRLADATIDLLDQCKEEQNRAARQLAHARMRVAGRRTAQLLELASQEHAQQLQAGSREREQANRN